MLEPWLRGPLPDISPLLAPAVYALQQVREELPGFLAGREALLWVEQGTVAPLGFQLKHIAGSINRLLTYLNGGTLCEEQLASLAAEKEPTGSLVELMAGVEEALDRAMAVIAALPEAEWTQPRYIGRKRVEVTAFGLAFHIAEHTQRHAGQLIVTSKL